MIDANKHKIEGKWTEKLQEESISLKEALISMLGIMSPKIYVNGSIPIDAVYHTNDIKISNIKLLKFLESGGDHRYFVVDYTT